jgi:uncharacterized damage-inducible protein DinB
MTAINRIAQQFTDLQHGDCWIGINFKEAFKGVDAALAAKNLDTNRNSIWQLVFHVIYWRSTVINRLNGSMNPPPVQDFSLPETLDEASWKQTLIDFESTYHQLRSTIQHSKEENLLKPSIKPEQTNEQLLLGCLQHDAYHLGQLVLLKKMYQ